jgi:hypothetical protein
MHTGQADDAGGTPAQRAALLSALVTEHFVVQSQRGVESSEAASRASLYLATLSGAMIALGFVSGTDHLAAFLGALIPLVFLLGLVTFARLVALEIQDFGWLRDIQRIRNYYRQLAPGAVTSSARWTSTTDGPWWPRSDCASARGSCSRRPPR